MVSKAYTSCSFALRDLSESVTDNFWNYFRGSKLELPLETLIFQADLMQLYFCGMCRFLVPVHEFNRKGEVHAGFHEPLDNLGQPRICIEVKLTLLNSAHNVGFEL